MDKLIKDDVLLVEDRPINRPNNEQIVLSYVQKIILCFQPWGGGVHFVDIRDNGR